ncbi:hypothetical protein [Paenibacillus sp. Soil787]|uniref:hypothetical protein n=1 Tax=Paenibacillus sp. Soil787 TaxID=1736411 RepID=UPI0006F94A00|nr:hypothetical protein [Paenibacillus sp. Soil787]KRF41894.1 hypothetical protein ASG93_22315 [Paenibacillus sp. Soil787]
MNKMSLWYRMPASEWNEVLPLGNGNLREAELVTSLGGICKLRVPHAAKLVVYGQDGAPVGTASADDGCAEFHAQKNMRYRIAT